jgi:hypothetical protein
MGPLALALPLRWHRPNSGVAKVAIMGPLPLAFPLRWRVRDAGVGEGASN